MNKKRIKKYLIIGLIIIEAFTLTLTYKSYGNKILDNVKEEYEVDKNKFSMYIETKDNEGNISYEEYNESGIFPTGYKINLEKSKCTDIKGNVIEGILSGRRNKVTITSNKTAYCYIYFDIDYKLSELCTSGDNLGSCLTTNNEEIDSLGDTAYSEMYRYTGTDLDVDDNYICFGTDDKEKCINNPDTYMYRVIGVTSTANDTLGLETNQLKLIKHTSIGTHQWHSDYTTDTKWESSTMHTYLQNDVLNNSTYYPSGWNNKIDSVKWNIGDSQEWNNGSTIYGLESSSRTSSESKLGLMYLSDYYYAYIRGGTANCGSTYCINWLTDTSNTTWTMTRYGGTDGYNAWPVNPEGYVGNDDGSVIDSYSVRPSFYLNVDEQYISGDGTIDNPIVLDGGKKISDVCSSGDNLGECLTENNEELYSLDNTAYSGMYRYTGTDLDVDDNYICFGTDDKEKCVNNPDAYMYRVIGVTSEANDTLGLEINQLKLIKHTSIGTMQWYTDNTTDVKWEYSIIYQNINGSNFLTNSTYMPNGWNNKIDSVKWNIGDVRTYTNGLAIYELEKSLQTTNTSKVGLMYLSDYYYAYNTGGIQNCNILPYCISWMENNSNAFLSMTRLGKDSNGYIFWNIYTNGKANGTYIDRTSDVRPVFYLNSDEQYMSGDGTLDNPIMLADKEAPVNNSVKINNNDTYTTSTSVTLTLASTGAKEMCISNTESCSNWEDYATSKSHTLTSSLGTKTVYVYFRDELGNTTEAITDTISLYSVISSTPSQSGTLTYTGSSQAPTWSNYDSTKLTIGGTTSNTNAGTYNATFTPKTNYIWSDGTTTAKTVSWSIGKVAGSLSVSPTSLTIKTGATGTITATRAGNGTVSATSSNTSVATVSVSGTTITVTGKAVGSATITVKVAAGTNHNAPANKTISVTVESNNYYLYDNGTSAVSLTMVNSCCTDDGDGSTATKYSGYMYLDTYYGSAGFKTSSKFDFTGYKKISVYWCAYENKTSCYTNTLDISNYQSSYYFKFSGGNYDDETGDKYTLLYLNTSANSSAGTVTRATFAASPTNKYYIYQVYLSKS